MTTSALIAELLLRNPIAIPSSSSISSSLHSSTFVENSNSSSIIPTKHIVYTYIEGEKVYCFLLNERYIWRYSGDFTELYKLLEIQLHGRADTRVKPELLRRYQEKITVALQQQETQSYDYMLVQVKTSKSLHLQVYRKRRELGLIGLIPLDFNEDTSHKGWDESTYLAFAQRLNQYYGFLSLHSTTVLQNLNKVNTQIQQKCAQLSDNTKLVEQRTTKKQEIESQWIHCTKLLVEQKNEEIRKLNEELRLYEKELSELQSHLASQQEMTR
jgi:hypothetical protein